MKSGNSERHQELTSKSSMQSYNSFTEIVPNWVFKGESLTSPESILQIRLQAMPSYPNTVAACYQVKIEFRQVKSVSS